MNNENNEVVLIDGRTDTREKRFYLKKVEHMELADMKLAGKSLEEIAKVRGVSRERIRQILKQYFPDIKFPRHAGFRGGRLKDPNNTIVVKCLRCGKPVYCYKNISKGIRKYCGQFCFLTSRGRKKLPISISQMTKEQYRIYHNKKCHDNYHKVHNDPAFKAKIKEYNRKANEKRKLLKNETK